MTHNQGEEEIKRVCKEEREGSLVPIFPPPSFGIVRILVGRTSFCSKVSALRVKRGWFLLNMIRAFCIKFGVPLVTSFWLIKEALNRPRNQSKRLWSNLL